MEKCKWSHYKFGMYFQMTEKNKFQVLKKKDEQWITAFQIQL